MDPQKTIRRLDRFMEVVLAAVRRLQNSDAVVSKIYSHSTLHDCETPLLCSIDEKDYLKDLTLTLDMRCRVRLSSYTTLTL